MKISTTTSRLARLCDFEKAIDILAAAGYDALDFSVFEKKFYDDTYNKDYYLHIRKYAEDKGLYFNQSHAPFGSSFPEADRTEQRFTEIVTAMKHASYLGVRNIVVHPCQHIDYSTPGNPEKLFEINMDFYKRLIPYAEEYDIKVALENMWQTPVEGVIGHSTCSRPDEFIKYLDELNNEAFVGCLDIGHALLVREMPDEFIRKLGSKRLKCLHVHDVDGTVDSHTLPYFGKVNWEKVMTALAEIGYEGEITFEADNFFNSKPDSLLPHTAAYMAKTGRALADIFENAK